MTEDDPIQSWLRAIKRSGTADVVMTDLATGLLNQYRAQHPRARFPPLAQKLTSLRDISFDRERESVTSGHLQVSNRGFVLRLGASGNAARRNFTIAHEIGHTFFFNVERKPPSPLLLPSEMANHEIERLCNLFAVSLLLPKSTLKSLLPELNSGPISLPRIEQISRRFTVSPETLIRRIKSLGLFQNPLSFIMLAKRHGGGREPVVDIIASPLSRAVVEFDPSELFLESLSSGDGVDLTLDIRLGEQTLFVNALSKVYGRGPGRYSVACVTLPEPPNLKMFP